MGECSRCTPTADDPREWRCGACGSPLATPLAEPSRDTLTEGVRGAARYRRWLRVPDLVSIGEPETPLVPLDWGGLRVWLKHEGALPTGSFKDRGSSALFGVLRAAGVARVAEDSSGNAGASFAAYAAAAGIGLDLFVPSSASPSKLAQARAYGADLRTVDGARENATDAAIAFAEEHGGVYASHQWQPAFNLGTQTFAFELWEQLGGEPPDALVCPVGAGGLLLGARLGFRALRLAGLVVKEPRLIGVQSAACAPLARAIAGGLDEPAPIERGVSVAEGVLLANPPRGGESIAAARESGGTIVAVDDERLWAAHEGLRRAGQLVELTGALGVAAIDSLVRQGALRKDETTVIALTGHGLKTAEAVAARAPS